MSTTNTQTDTLWFGAGYVYGLATSGGTLGTPVSLIQPGNFATVQEASVDITVAIKELRGATEDPEDTRSASRKITGKITTGRINLSQLNDFVFGEGVTEGSVATMSFEAHNAGVASPPTATLVITPPSSGVFLMDLGVWYAGTRNQLEAVSTAPSAAGTYKCAATTGTYTFFSSDEGTAILVSYRYTTTGGHTLDVTNQIMGNAVRPVLMAYLTNQAQGDNELVLYQCRASKIAMPIKREDYCILELDFQAFANVSGQTLTFLSSV